MTMDHQGITGLQLPDLKPLPPPPPSSFAAAAKAEGWFHCCNTEEEIGFLFQ